MASAPAAMWAWGLNDDGQLGDGTTMQSSHPVRVQKEGGGLLGSVDAVACGQQHTVALDDVGRVWAWGAGRDGQIGDDELQDTPRAVRVIDDQGSPLSQVQAVAAGRYHSLALKDGTVWAWGANNYGQIGAKTGDRIYYTATQVFRDDNTILTPLTGVRAIAAGQYFSLAITEDDILFAWGRNNLGQFGDGTFDPNDGAPQMQAREGREGRSLECLASPRRSC